MLAYQELYILRGVYATNELNSTTTMMEMRKLAKTKSLKLQQFFLASFFAFIARPTLSNYIEEVMRSSRTLISKIVASSVAIVAASISSQIPIYTVEAPLCKPLKPISLFNPVIRPQNVQNASKSSKILWSREEEWLITFSKQSRNSSQFHWFLLNLHFQ